MIEIVNGNILDAPLREIVCHQTNTNGAFGSGIAGQIRKKYPDVYKKYIKLYEDGDATLGTAQLCLDEDSGRIIANLFAQDDYGSDGKKYTDYNAFYNCLLNLKLNLRGAKMIISFPYNIGCGLGGGEWNVIYALIESALSDYHVKIYCLDV